MRKIIATIIKEWILARRDAAGITLLFLMPAMLIVVMALVQDAPFKDYQEVKFDLLIADDDKGPVATAIKEALKKGNKFKIIDEINGKPVTEKQLKKALLEGDYKVGLVIPKGITAEIVNAANIVANSISSNLGIGTLPSRPPRDSMKIRMYFDPVTKPTYRMSVSFALDKHITFAGSHVLVERLAKLGGGENNGAPAEDFERIFKGIGIEERMITSSQGAHNVIVNSVQHNVPAWAIFGMFFIVVPICSHLIREREEGSALRIELIPNARKFVSLGKILFYTMICTVQFIVMFCIGLWILPLLGLPALSLGTNYYLLIPIAIAISIAATAYGYFIGVTFKTTNQAMPFGAISVVILSAMGGLWIPVDVLSPIMQKIAMASPLYWGLDAVNNITLRNGNWENIQLHISILLLFSLIMWGISTQMSKNRRQSL